MVDDIIKIMKEIFEMDEAEKLLSTDTQQQIVKWDSLAQMELVTKLEEIYNVKFDFMDLIKMDSAIEIEKIILKKKGLN